MTTIDHPAQTEVAAPRRARKGSIMADWLSSTDHKVIGHLYLITSFGFFLVAGLMHPMCMAIIFKMLPDSRFKYHQPAFQ